MANPVPPNEPHELYASCPECIALAKQIEACLAAREVSLAASTAAVEEDDFPAAEFHVESCRSIGDRMDLVKKTYIDHRMESGH